MWIDDDILARADESLVVATWVPPRPMVVLGRSNQPQQEVNTDWCKQHNVALLQRYGGGGTVVLYDGCLVVSVGCWVNKLFHNEHFFKTLNQSVINTIASFDGAMSLGQAGISDITLGDRKVGGTSLFRSGHYLLYQASVICRLDLGLIENCLKHPSKEPEYRGRRSHAEFLADLTMWNVEPHQLKQHFDYHFIEQVIDLLGDDQIEPVAKNLKNIEARYARGLDGEGQLS